MDASPGVLAGAVRAKRDAIDNDLELLRVRMQKVDPRRVDARRWARTALPLVAGTAAVWLWRKRRRSMGSLQDLLVHQLRDLYRIEHELLAALRRMSEKASNPELRKALEHHAYETDTHVERLARVFRSVGARPANGRSRLASGLVADGERLLKVAVDPEVRDAWLIATVQRMEHVEIAICANAKACAETLGYTYAAQLLQETLEEERATDEKLARLGERFVNLQAIRRARR